MSDSHLSRRQFVAVVSAFIGGIIGAVVGLPAIGYLISPASQGKKAEGKIPVGPVDKIPTDVPTLFNFTRTKVNGWEKTSNSYGVYILRTQNNELKIFSNVCTHLSCRVNWDASAQEFKCPCHAAVFDINGNVVNGPPPRPLDMLPAEVDENGNLFLLFQEA